MRVLGSTPLGDYLAAHLGSRDVTRVVYGSVIGLALVVALEDHPPSATQTVAAVLGTALAVALAEVYSDIVGTEARTRRRVDARQLRAMGGASAAVAFGAGFPALFFTAAAVGLMEIDLAFVLSKWTGLGLLGAYGFLGARLSGSTRVRALGHAGMVGAVGGFLIVLKALLH